MAEILTGGCHFVACRELSLEPPTLRGYEPEPICNIPQANYFWLDRLDLWPTRSMAD